MSSKGPPPVSPFKHDALAGQVMLISGGSSGIGLEIARPVARHGAKVMLMGRRADVIDAAVAQLRAEGAICDGEAGDVRRPQDCERLVASTITKFNKLSILCNCAAGNFLATADELKPKGFQTVIDIDLHGVFNMTHAAFPHLKAAAAQTGDAVLINISAVRFECRGWFVFLLSHSLTHHCLLPFRLASPSHKLSPDFALWRNVVSKCTECRQGSNRQPHTLVCARVWRVWNPLGRYCPGPDRRHGRLL